MKLTLLQLTQNILSAMESDEVNSISDTVEAMQVAYVIQDTYYQLIEQRNIPELYQLFQLTGLGDTDHPNYLQIPDSVTEISWWKYNKQLATDTDKFYSEVNYLTPEEFIFQTNQNKSSDSFILTIQDISNGVELLIANDAAPRWYTSFDDKYIVCDSYDSSVDTTLQASKTQVWAKSEPVWDMSDDYTPLLDDSLFPALLAEAKSTCFSNIKQITNGKVDKQSRQQLIKFQNDKHRLKSINSQFRGSRFGRKTYQPPSSWLAIGRDSHST